MIIRTKSAGRCCGWTRNSGTPCSGSSITTGRPCRGRTSSIPSSGWRCGLRGFPAQGARFALSIKQTLKTVTTMPCRAPTSSVAGPTAITRNRRARAMRPHSPPTWGLENCMVDRVPVGVLIQATPKPNVTYKVWGLAMVRSARWRVHAGGALRGVGGDRVAR